LLVKKNGLDQCFPNVNLAKNLGGGLWLRNIFRGGKVKFFLKILLQVCENLERSQIFSGKYHFLAKKVKFFSRGRVAFKKNFNTLPTPLTHKSAVPNLW
jgi:hypothetical protein